MRLLVIRHAIAAPHGTPGVSDDDRPLTERGIQRFRSAARGLAEIIPPPGALLSSPRVRTMQTAEIASKAFGGVKITEEPALASGSFKDLAASLGGLDSGSLVALVGHEPHVSNLVARLLGARDPGRFGFRKGGAALVDVPASLEAGGSLVWFLPPRVLRALGGNGGGDED